MESQPQLSRKKYIAPKTAIFIVIALLLGGAVGYSIKAVDASNLAEQKNRLALERSKMQSQNDKLQRSNETLTQAARQLQSQTPGRTHDAHLEEDRQDSPPAAPAGMVTVHAVAREGIFVAASGDRPRTSYDHIAVRMTLKNLTASNQHYSMGHFTAVTDDGVIVRPTNFGPMIETQVWNWSDLAPQGQQTVTVYFPIDNNYVFLNWDVPGGTEPITVALPTVE